MLYYFLPRTMWLAARCDFCQYRNTHPYLACNTHVGQETAAPNGKEIMYPGIFSTSEGEIVRFTASAIV